MATAANNAQHPGSRRILANFGGNRTWQPLCYRPGDEQEVLEILARHRTQRIRAIGSLHSWSDIAVVDSITLDMSQFNEVQPFVRNGATFVRVGAGCTLQELLDRLHANTDRTLPTLGVIKRQTLAGIISTATHGSGKPSVSHFVTAVRVAAYDAGGTPRIFEHREGDELRAARCALGCMGVILSIELATVARYRVRETVRRLDRIEDALGLYEDHPLTQFALVPYGWKFIVWERHMVPPGGHGGGRIKARFCRVFNLVGIDVLSHVFLKVSLMLGRSAVRGLLKLLPSLLIANVARIDDAEHVLTLRHDLFRHEEMEMFVPESRVTDAAQLARLGIEVFAGDRASVPADVEQKLRAAGLYDELMEARGSYVHHYPMLFRRVLPEDTLISMVSASDEAWFSFSLFTFDKPRSRSTYYQFCSWFARSMHALFGARLHWGKHYPLGATETARMYPNLERFKQMCRASDPTGVFRNEFTGRVLELR
jgi:FAD/FMN-containing dehydrogenase